MRRLSKTSIRLNGETYFGVEIAPDGTLVAPKTLAAPADAEACAVHLARLAERLF